MKVKEFPVHCPTDQPRRVQSFVAQGSDEGLGLPMAKGGVIDRARSAHPVVLAMLVLMDVSLARTFGSSINAKLVIMLRMKG
jgi:hypothetical protein